MQFRLVYEGLLLGQNSLASHKWDIRRIFHPQLQTLWNQEPLSFLSSSCLKPSSSPAQLSSLRQRGQITFIPLVTFDLKIFVEISVLLLRPRVAGQRPTDRGDADNQLKTLLDALRMPSPSQKIDTDLSSSLSNPFHCLLEDDCLVTKVSFETEQWLSPRNGNESLAIITVDIKRSYLTGGNSVF